MSATTAHAKLGRNPFEKRAPAARKESARHASNGHAKKTHAHAATHRRSTARAESVVSRLEAMVRLGWEWILHVIHMWISWLKTALQSLGLIPA